MPSTASVACYVVSGRYACLAVMCVSVTALCTSRTFFTRYNCLLLLLVAIHAT